MLRLKRVELQGFKSFFDRTELRFHGNGVAAIVGPNGCGKSNLSDAISWVLGEQSAKSLRGARMEDVIFAGTRDRKPLGMAAVNLTLVNPGSETPHAGSGENGNGSGNGHANGHGVSAAAQTNGEVVITRRLYRSGESEYLINGKTARLRDIQELFMGTGLGPESYAIIEQGRIGQILSNRPQDRRAVIEEAAGISRFKTKKRLAEAKLESARQNLNRVFDILEEVSRQVNSLKRQASKARRYEELRKELIAQLRQALSGRFRMLEREAAKLALDLNLADGEFQGLSAGVTAKEHEQSALQAQCYRTEQELTEARRRLAELQLESERARSRLEYQAKQIGGIEQRLGQGESETQDLERRHAGLARELEAHRETLARLAAETESARARLATKNEERESLQNNLREREQAMENARREVLRLLGEASTLKNQLAQVEEYLAAIERDTQRLRKEEQTASGDLERLDRVKIELSEKLAARQLELESLADRRREVEEHLAVRKTRIGESRRKLEELRGELSRQTARKDSLEEILSHRAYTTESVKQLFTAIEQRRAGDLKPAGVLADFVEVLDASYEKAIEEFLHEELEYVVVSGWSEAERGIDLMRSDVDGRATFLVHPEPSTSPAAARTDVVAEPGITARLGDLLRLTNGFTGTPLHVLPRLSNCYLAADRPTAQHLAGRYPDLYFLLPEGVSYHGCAVSGGKKTGSGPLALKRELRELISQVQVTQKDVDDTTAVIEDLEQESALLAEDLERLRGLQQAQEKDALALDHEQRKLAEEYSRAGSRLSLARLDLDRLRNEDARSREQRETSQALVTEKEQARFDQEMALEQARSEFDRLQAHAHRITEEYTAVRAEMAGLEERRRSAQSVESRLQAQLREIAQRREDLTAELERLGVERARLLADNIELDTRAAALAENIAASDGAVRNLVDREVDERAGLSALEESLKALRAEVRAAHERRSEIELELVKKQAELKYLDETARKELGAALEEIAAGEETVPDEDALAEAEQKYQELRARIEALGPVNPQALEEFQEAQQRYDFLNTQRQDLLDSIRDTETAIQEIDVESRRRFAEAFEAVNAHFRDMFRTLFGGGTGEMRLTDETNLAESGIDIVASPPGKKLQNVLLLSGGEKSLTAMALLMAIFRYQPSPFCVLDEVDAALDEANIVRLTYLIKEMSRHTQFIVITHAKRTMEAAQALYGVTMQEPGISKLVSVKFDPLPEQTVPTPMEAVAAN